MHELQPTIDQHRALRLLGQRFRNQNIPHALIFSGIDGIGRQAMAIRFALAANCVAPPFGETRPTESKDPQASDKNPLSACGECPSCKKIRTDQHPDVLHIKPAGKTIKIEQIRSLIRKLTLKPYEASQRVVIIESAPSMTLPAANALLKVLEEPPERTTIVLIANKTADLIATIVSRCQSIRLDPIADHRMVETLLKENKVSPEMAEMVAYLAQGSMMTADTLLSKGGEKQIRWIIKEIAIQCQLVLNANNQSPRRAMALSALLANNQLLKERFFSVMKLWLRDLAVWSRAPKEVRYWAAAEDFDDLANAVQPDMAILLFSAIEQMENDATSNANSRLAMEAYFTGMGGQLSSPILIHG